MDFIEKLKALIEKLKAIGDAIRVRTGDTEPLTLDEMVEAIKSMDVIDDGTNTYILVDENGNEVPAVLVDEPVMLTANATTDIRKGMTAVTDEGVVTGEKEIPAYYVTEGSRLIPAGSSFYVTIRNGRYAYTKLQALFCKFGSGMSTSVCTDRVAIGSSVYPVNSTDVLASVTVNPDTEAIVFGVTNDSGAPYVIRYFTYKEEQ